MFSFAQTAASPEPVEVLMERLSGYGITLDQIANTIQSANAELATGGTEAGGASW